MNIVKLRPIWYAFSALLIAGSIFSFATFGLKQGIDFTGGSLVTIRFEQRPESAAIEQALKDQDLGTIVIQPIGEKDMNIRMRTLDEQGHADVLKAITTSFSGATELRYDSIGPSIGAELRQKSWQALLVVFLAIMAYIAYTFRKVSAPVQSWKYGVITIITAFHDVIVPIGVFTLLGKYANVEVGTPFIAAILTIMGYSINDTIIVFDRVRENLQRVGGDFEHIVNLSLKQTYQRSFNTSMTTLFPLMAIYFFGGSSIQDFALALIIGIVTGTYSSIFIASPLVVSLYRWSKSRSTR